MELQLPIKIPQLKPAIRHSDRLFLIGSCFSENIADRLQKDGFAVSRNPQGILFNPISVASGMIRCLEARPYQSEDLFYLNELWNNWDHHSKFSHTDRDAALAGMNAALSAAGAFLKEADWVILTLGSAFQYFLTEGGIPVANNHRAPGNFFEKRLLEIKEIEARMQDSFRQLWQVNPEAQVLLTISPVRHIRDGVVENNRSKARLIEAVHSLVAAHEAVSYFPSYELLIDVYRDYRFYDLDLVHPNYLATDGVYQAFLDHCVAGEDKEVIARMRQLRTALAHRPRFPETEAHKKFKRDHAALAKSLSEKYPYLNLEEMLAHFAE